MLNLWTRSNLFSTKQQEIFLWNCFSSLVPQKMFLIMEMLVYQLELLISCWVDELPSNVSWENGSLHSFFSPADPQNEKSTKTSPNKLPVKILRHLRFPGIQNFDRSNTIRRSYWLPLNREDLSSIPTWINYFFLFCFMWLWSFKSYNFTLPRSAF